MRDQFNILKSAIKVAQMSSKDLAAIDRQIERLKNRRTAVLAQDAAAERRRRTRRSIIIGAWIQQHRPDIVEAVKAGLTREQDRAAFGSRSAPIANKVDIDLPLDDVDPEVCDA
jgi:hypothetical protein